MFKYITVKSAPIILTNKSRSIADSNLSENGFRVKYSVFQIIAGKYGQSPISIDLANLERPFIVTDEKGQPLALFAAFAAKKPGSIKVEEYTPEYNTGNVGIPLKINKN